MERENQSQGDEVECFAFFRSYEEALKMLPSPEEQLHYIEILLAAGLHGVDPNPDDSMAYKFYNLNARHVILKSRQKRKAGRSGGLKGGKATGESKARFGNRNAARTENQ